MSTVAFQMLSLPSCVKTTSHSFLYTRTETTCQPICQTHPLGAVISWTGSALGKLIASLFSLACKTYILERHKAAPVRFPQLSCRLSPVLQASLVYLFYNVTKLICFCFTALLISFSVWFYTSHLGFYRWSSRNKRITAVILGERK